MVTMTPEWLTSARADIDKALTASAAADRNEAAVKILELLNAHVEDLTAYGPAAAAGRANGWLTDLPDDASVLAILRTIVSKGATAGSVANLHSTLPRYADAVRLTLGSAWSSHVRNRVGGVDDLRALELVLSAVPGQSAHQKTLSTARQLVDGLQRSIPSEASEAELGRAAEVVDEAFKKSVRDQEVREFLIDCSRSGATVGQLTEGVRAWLAENGAAGAFRVTMEHDE